MNHPKVTIWCEITVVLVHLLAYRALKQGVEDGNVDC